MGQVNTIKVAWSTEGLHFNVHDEHGNTTTIDTAKEWGGLDKGFRPAELLLVSLAGCMAMDIVSILQKKGGRITSFTATVQGERAEKHPKAYEKIVVTFDCQGEYAQEDLERSFELSRDKYCGVFATLNTPPTIEFKL
jgi:putative redox protein